MLVLAGCSAGPGGSVGPSGSSAAPGALEGSRWHAVSIAGQPPLPANVPTLVFERGGISGNAGCNGYGATRVEVSGTSITIHDLGMTAMACLDQRRMTMESTFFAALAAATTVQVVDGRLSLSGPRGELVFEAGT